MRLENAGAAFEKKTSLISHRHGRPGTLGAFLLLVCLCSSAYAQVTQYEEQYKLIRAPRALSTLGPDLFGDAINLYNGTLSFTQTDVSLKGNNALPVAVGRRIAAGTSPPGSHAFGKWDIDIPRLHGTFAAKDLWSAYPAGARCSSFGEPMGAAGVNGASAWSAQEFWHGNFMYIPGVGDQELLTRVDAASPSPGPISTYPVVTSKFWYLSCLPTLANAGAKPMIGEGFVAFSPDGTRYYFDWMAEFVAPGLMKSDPGAARTIAPQNALVVAHRASKEAALGDVSVSARATSTEVAGALAARGISDDTSSANFGTLPPEQPDQIANPSLLRSEVWLLPTRVVDKFGNTVFYTYDPANPSRLMHIESPSDGRNLWLTYRTDGLVETVSDGFRTWQYSYSGAGLTAELTTVTLPDGTYWDFSQFSPLLAQPNYVNDGGCDALPMFANGPVSGAMKHPMGATATFNLAPTVHGRSHIQRSCQMNVSTQKLDIPRFFGTMSVTQKTLTGPGLPNMAWSYDYGARNESWDTCPECISTKTVSVTDPTGAVMRHTFGNARDFNEGRPLATETFAADGSSLQSTSQRYQVAGAGPYPFALGFSYVFGGDNELGTLITPINQRITTQQGVNFVWEGSEFDTLARPRTVLKQSGLNPGRIERTTYYDQAPIWVMGQTAAVDANEVGSPVSKRVVLNTYNDPTATLETSTRFGLLEKSLTYYADGTIKTVSDGKNQTTSLFDYKRGVPRRLVHPDNSVETAVVGDNGTIDSVTDANGYTTSFTYDAMQRLASVMYAAAPGDPAWNATNLTLTQVNTGEFDLAPGHWRQDVVTGTAWTRTYLDALWRPAYTLTYQDGISSTQSLVKTDFDHAGRTTFSSYPRRDYDAQLMQGVRTVYDALGRTTQIHTDTELGNLFTSFYYDVGFRKVMRDQRSNQTTTSYQAFDTPTEDAIATVIAPEWLTVGINRDVFGKPTAITRSGNGASATRQYIYDGYGRLCKTIEPETGATLQVLDAANNVTWRAPGTSLTSAACDTGSVPAGAKISFGYDAMNRLTSTSYGDGSAAIGRDYWADGQPKTVSSSGAVWTMNYNGRRLPTAQSLAFEGQTYTLETGYNANGHPMQLTYPAATNTIAARTVTYDPDALGRPSHVGTYASGISYHPNGAVAGFTYGNGKVRSMTPNLRGLPEVSEDSGVMRDVYGYDENGNVTAITDQAGNGTSRGMAYDGLDRLTVANAPGIWGNASYGYDALDNIKTSTIGGRINSYNYGARNLLDSLQSTAGGFTYSFGYDNRGNVTSRNGQAFVFDLGNRLTSATNLDAYVYDGFGRRVKTTAVDGTVTISVYSPAGQLLYTRRTGGPNPAQSTQHIYLHSHQVAEVKK